MPGLKWLFLVFGFILLVYGYKTKDRSGFLQAVICFAWYTLLEVYG